MSLAQLSQSADSHDTPSRGKRSFAWLLPVGLLVGFLLIMALLFGSRLIPATEVTTAPVITLRQEASAAAQPSTPDTTTETVVTKGQMLFQASGWVEPDPYITYVPALVNGVVDEVHVLEGEQVKKGQLLATLIDDDAKLNVQQVEQKIKSHQGRIDAHCQAVHIINAEIRATEKKITALRASVAEARDLTQRYDRLPKGAVPQQQVAAARFTLQRTEALVAQAEAELPKQKAQIEQIEFERLSMESVLTELNTDLARAQLALDRTRITAPMDGIVLHLHVAPGKKRMLTMDDPHSAVVVELYDPQKLQARIDVPLTEAAGMQVGQIVEITSDLLPDMTFNGRVTRITGQADLQRNTLQAKVAIEKPDIRLRPEMLVRGKFFAKGGSRAVTSSSGTSASTGRLAIYVPEEALVNDSSVWVVDTNNKARLRSLELSNDSREQHRRVLDGIRSGEHVILPPHDQLKDGTRVSPQPIN